MIPESDRTIVIPESIYLELEEMASAERKKVLGTGPASELQRRCMTPLSVAQKMLRDGCKKTSKITRDDISDPYCAVSRERGK